ncbi:MAG: hypothetical protein ABEK59_10425 [Halobacteria archaeon]
MGKRFIRIVSGILFLIILSASTASAWAIVTHEEITKDGTELVKEDDPEKYEDVLKHEKQMVRGSDLEDAKKRYVNHFDPRWNGYSQPKRDMAQLFFDLPRGQKKNQVTKATVNPYTPLADMMGIGENVVYKSAPDWIYDDGWGRNWESAVEMYGYTEASRKRAFLRLGHVLHIVEDLSELDHATSTPHPGSSYWEKGNEFNSALSDYDASLVGSQFPPLQNESHTGVDFAHPYAMGFEKFTAKEGIHKKGTHPFDYGNDPSALKRHFSDAQSKTKAAARGAEVEAPLGLNDTTMANFHMRPTIVPENNPVLRRTEQNVGPRWMPEEAYRSYFQNPPYDQPHIEKPGPYRDYAKTATKFASMHVAGVEELFYDIVNQPPYVDRFKVGGKYNSHWENSYNLAKKSYEVDGTEIPAGVKTVNGRSQDTQKEPLICGETYDVKLVFGPNDAKVKEKIRRGATSVKVGNTKLNGNLNKKNGNVWEGKISVPEKTKSMSLAEWRTKVERLYGQGQVKIKSRDIHEHALEKPKRANNLDTRIGIPARVKSQDFDKDLKNRPPSFTWIQYIPGVDKHHDLDFKCGEEVKQPAVKKKKKDVKKPGPKKGTKKQGKKKGKQKEDKKEKKHESKDQKKKEGGKKPSEEEKERQKQTESGKSKKTDEPKDKVGEKSGEKDKKKSKKKTEKTDKTKDKKSGNKKKDKSKAKQKPEHPKVIDNSEMKYQNRDKNVGCPPGYELRGDSHSLKDDNGDHQVCVKVDEGKVGQKVEEGKDVPTARQKGGKSVKEIGPDDPYVKGGCPEGWTLEKRKKKENDANNDGYVCVWRDQVADNQFGDGPKQETKSGKKGKQKGQTGKKVSGNKSKTGAKSGGKAGTPGKVHRVIDNFEDKFPDNFGCPPGYAPRFNSSSQKDKNGDGTVCLTEGKKHKPVQKQDGRYIDDFENKFGGNFGCPPGYTPIFDSNHPSDKNGDGTVCEKTSKGPPGKQDTRVIDNFDDKFGDNFGCPPGYTPVFGSDSPLDENGDGTVCEKARGKMSGNRSQQKNQEPGKNVSGEGRDTLCVGLLCANESYGDHMSNQEKRELQRGLRSIDVPEFRREPMECDAGDLKCRIDAVKKLDGSVIAGVDVRGGCGSSCRKKIKRKTKIGNWIEKPVGVGKTRGGKTIIFPLECEASNPACQRALTRPTSIYNVKFTCGKADISCIRKAVSTLGGPVEDLRNVSRDKLSLGHLHSNDMYIVKHDGKIKYTNTKCDAFGPSDCGKGPWPLFKSQKSSYTCGKRDISCIKKAIKNLGGDRTNFKRKDLAFDHLYSKSMYITKKDGKIQYSNTKCDAFGPSDCGKGPWPLFKGEKSSYTCGKRDMSCIKKAVGNLGGDTDFTRNNLSLDHLYSSSMAITKEDGKIKYTNTKCDAFGPSDCGRGPWPLFKGEKSNYTCGLRDISCIRDAVKKLGGDSTEFKRKDLALDHLYSKSMYITKKDGKIQYSNTKCDAFGPSDCGKGPWPLFKGEKSSYTCGKRDMSCIKKAVGNLGGDTDFTRNNLSLDHLYSSSMAITKEDGKIKYANTKCEAFGPSDCGRGPWPLFKGEKSSYTCGKRDISCIRKAVKDLGGDKTQFSRSDLALDHLYSKSMYITKEDGKIQYSNTKCEAFGPSDCGKGPWPLFQDQKNSYTCEKNDMSCIVSSVKKLSDKADLSENDLKLDNVFSQNVKIHRNRMGDVVYSNTRCSASNTQCQRGPWSVWASESTYTCGKRNLGCINKATKALKDTDVERGDLKLDHAYSAKINIAKNRRGEIVYSNTRCEAFGPSDCGRGPWQLLTREKKKEIERAAEKKKKKSGKTEASMDANESGGKKFNIDRLKKAANSYFAKNPKMAKEMLGGERVLIEVKGGQNYFGVMEDGQVADVRPADGTENETTVLQMNATTAERISQSSDPQAAVKMAFDKGYIEIKGKTIGNKVKYGLAKAAKGIKEFGEDMADKVNNLFGG